MYFFFSNKLYATTNILRMFEKKRKEKKEKEKILDHHRSMNYRREI